MIYNYFCFIIISLFIFSCGNSEEQKAKIIGSWETVQWTIKNTDRVRNNQMDFEFLENDRYKVDYGSETEVGKYWFEGNDLYTIEDESAMKKVTVNFVNADSMTFEMNRAGQIELVQLKKSSE